MFPFGSLEMSVGVLMPKDQAYDSSVSDSEFYADAVSWTNGVLYMLRNALWGARCVVGVALQVRPLVASLTGAEAHADSC